jgi:N-acyl homoserine lactone hydrolase
MPRPPSQIFALRIDLARALVVACVWLTGCSVSTHPVTPSDLGTARRSADLLAVVDQPGPLQVETINASEWSVDRSGLLDLDDPRAKAAGLKDGDEPIQIFFHVIHHPQKGTFLIDTGVERALRDAPDRAAVRGLVATVAHVDRMKVHEPLGDWLARQAGPLAGVFFTHLHIDHIAGAPDLPPGTPIYAGPGETSSHAFANLFIQGVTDRALEGKGPLHEWPFAPDPDGRFSVVDVFSDGSLWAIWVPGHTPGSTAYLARTPSGPVLFVGDTCHTRWGWENHVAPGAFTEDRASNVISLEKLERLVAEHPGIDVRLGHQYLHGPPKVAASP